MQLPMDIALHIIKQTKEANVSPTYSARLTIGNPTLLSGVDSEEVFWCAAAGKSFIACIEAVKARALLWAKRGKVEHINGLTDNNPCPLLIRAGPQEIEITPVTYNDQPLQIQTENL